jgi:AcrR family transcriptional regulator
MIVSTALLMRERGARGTSLDDVLTHSGAPRGSLYHHFPGGREQLMREATLYAGEHVARRLERAGEGGPRAVLDALLDEYATTLKATDFRAGCPVVAVAVEAPEEGPDLREYAKAAFERWRLALARQLERAGVDADRAADLAVLTISAVEGALILSRAYRDLAPLESVRRDLTKRYQSELERTSR